MSLLWFPGCCPRGEACFWAHTQTHLHKKDHTTLTQEGEGTRAFMPGVVLVCHRRDTCVYTKVCNQSRFGTLQEVINSQDYCADTMISKVLHNSLCGKGWLNQSTWKGERDVRFAASCRDPSASLPAPAVRLLCEEEGVWTSKSRHATLETETISKGSGERWQRGGPHSIIKKHIGALLGRKGNAVF